MTCTTKSSRPPTSTARVLFPVEDLNLDIRGISAWFHLVGTPPSSPVGVPSLETAYDRIFREYLIPLVNDSPTRSIVFLEYGAMDVVAAPHSPANLDPDEGPGHSLEWRSRSASLWRRSASDSSVGMDPRISCHRGIANMPPPVAHGSYMRV